MKILLVYPSITFLERYSSRIGNAGGRQIPLGVYYLASAVRRAGHEVRVIDAEAQGMDISAVTAEVLESKPDIVGISATTVAFNNALATARRIKDGNPSVPVVMGGPHVTAVGELALQHREIDYAVIGEGEETLMELLQTLKTGQDLQTIKGIAFRREGNAVQTEPRPFIAALDSIAFPAYDLIPDLKIYNPPPTNYRELPVANVITSRGCPNKCTFCGHSAFGRTLRQRSPENIADEILNLCQQRDVREIAFVDDTFTIGSERIVKLFGILKEKGIRFPWTCMSRISTADEALLRFMKEQGCWHISFGIESGNEIILQRIRKQISLPAVRKVISCCRDLGILTKGFFILGHPGETIETMDQTIRFALSLPLDDVVVTLNTPLPGTEQYHTASQYGRFDEPDWAKFNMWNPVFIPEGLTEEILLQKQREFYRRFYLRPRIVRRYAGSFLSRSGLRRALSIARSLPFLLSGDRK